MWESIIVFVIVASVALVFARSLYRKSTDGGQGACGGGCHNGSCPYSAANNPGGSCASPCAEAKPGPPLGKG